MDTQQMNDEILRAWEAGDLTDREAALSLWSNLREVESDLKPLEERRGFARAALSRVIDHLGGKLEIAGLGLAEITSPVITRSYDTKAIDALVIELLAEYPEIAQQLAACRREGARAGGLRITVERKKD